MRKRIAITVRNPGFERTDTALGVIHLDFEDEGALTRAIDTINGQLMVGKSHLQSTIVIYNEKGAQRGFNPEYYVSHQVDDVDEVEEPNWQLPSDGTDAPDRENES